MQRCCKVDVQEASGMMARVILFAAMAAFLDDVCLGFKRITDGATGTNGHREARICCYRRAHAPRTAHFAASSDDGIMASPTTTMLTPGGPQRDHPAVPYALHPALKTIGHCDCARVLT
jgi:hypothetical protein